MSYGEWVITLFGLTALAVRYLDQIVELIVELDDEPTYTMTHKLAIY